MRYCVISILFILYFNIMLNTSFCSEIIEGAYCYSYGDEENLVEARIKANKFAIRNAIETNNIFIKSTVSVHNRILIDELITTVSSACIGKVITKKHKENLSNKEICDVIEISLKENCDIPNIIEKSLSYSDFPTEHIEKTAKAISYCNGTSGQVNIIKARYLFLDSLKENPLSKMWVARSYKLGICGFPKDDDKANLFSKKSVNIIKKFADQGNKHFFFLMGSAYEEGLSIEKNIEHAKYWYQKAVKFNDTNAMVNLGRFYEKGYGCETNLLKAKDLFYRSSLSNNAKGMLNIGVIFDQLKKFEKAFYWYSKSAELNYSVAQRYVADCYEFGIGTKKNLPKAIKFYKLAYSQGDINAKESLARLKKIN